MKNTMKITRVEHKGFTLIELLVVIAIIAILTAIITANFAQARANSRDAKRVSDIAQIQLALELYFDRCNQYPFISGTIPNIAANNGCPAGISLSTFISAIPTPPNSASGEIYTYAVDNGSLPLDYVLMTTLESSGNAALNGDIDTTTYGVNCTDPRYCVVPR